MLMAFAHQRGELSWAIGRAVPGVGLTRDSGYRFGEGGQGLSTGPERDHGPTLASGQRAAAQCRYEPGEYGARLASPSWPDDKTGTVEPELGHQPSHFL